MTQGLCIHVPVACLKPFIQMFWLGEDEHSEVFSVTPDGCIDIVMRCGARLPQQLLIYGSTSRFTQLTIAPSHRYLGIRFQPGQARHFIDIPAWQLTDNYCDGNSRFLTWLLPAFEQEQPLKALQTLEICCLKWLKACDPRQQFVDRLIDGIITQPSIKLSLYCQQQGISERHLQRKFKDTVGLSPKMFQRVMRAHRVKYFLDRGENTPLIELAMTAGYSDQSHMQREIKQFFGHTPRELAETV